MAKSHCSHRSSAPSTVASTRSQSRLISRSLNPQVARLDRPVVVAGGLGEPPVHRKRPVRVWIRFFDRQELDHLCTWRSGYHVRECAAMRTQQESCSADVLHRASQVWFVADHFQPVGSSREPAFMISFLHDRFLDGQLLPTPHLYFVYFTGIAIARCFFRHFGVFCAHLEAAQSKPYDQSIVTNLLAFMGQSVISNKPATGATEPSNSDLMQTLISIRDQLNPVKPH